MSTNWDWGIFQCPQDRIGVKIYVHIYGYIIYSRVSLSVQKANYAAKMYLKIGFEIVKENEEEYIMVYYL